VVGTAHSGSEPGSARAAEDLACERRTCFATAVAVIEQHVRFLVMRLPVCCSQPPAKNIVFLALFPNPRSMAQRERKPV